MSENRNGRSKRTKILSVISIVMGAFCAFIFSLIAVLYLSQFHLDLSQDYRSIKGHENIVFVDPGNKQCFHLCAWGLIRTENAAGFEDHTDPDKSSYEYRLIAENTNAENIRQAVASPDRKYILYAEHIDVGRGFSTDEEKVYYRVYSIEDGTVTTVFSGYRQFLRVDWK